MSGHRALAGSGLTALVVAGVLASSLHAPRTVGAQPPATPWFPTPPPTQPFPTLPPDIPTPGPYTPTYTPPTPVTPRTATPTDTARPSATSRPTMTDEPTPTYGPSVTPGASSSPGPTVTPAPTTERRAYVPYTARRAVDLGLLPAPTAQPGPPPGRLLEPSR